MGSYAPSRLRALRYLVFDTAERIPQAEFGRWVFWHATYEGVAQRFKFESLPLVCTRSSYNSELCSYAQRLAQFGMISLGRH